MDDLLKLKIKEIQIIPNDLNLLIKEQTLFQANGGEGLHLWEASIVLSRYMISHPEIFNNKKIMELGAGCGLLGMSIIKKCPFLEYTFSDYNEQVLSNLKENLSLNKIKLENNKINIKNIDWRLYNNYQKEEYDILIGSELIYKGGYIEELAKLISKILKKDGICFISMPEKRSMTKTFFDFVEKEGMIWKSIYYENEENADSFLFLNVLKDKALNKKTFEDLKSMKLMLYSIYFPNNQ